MSVELEVGPVLAVMSSSGASSSLNVEDFLLADPDPGSSPPSLLEVSEDGDQPTAEPVVAESPCRVLQTAIDRPSPSQDSLPAVVDPALDHDHDDVVSRREDVEHKHELLRQWLETNGLDAVVLARADSIAWFTSGADVAQTLGGEHAAVLLYINRNQRAVISDNVQTARVFEEELAGLGFQLKERAWYNDPNKFVAELGHSKQVVTDNGLPPWPNRATCLRSLRWPLTRLERQHLRELGRTLTLAVEATCRNFAPGETEADVAGHLAHRLVREGVAPLELRIAGDGRLARYRQPSFKDARIQRNAVITATGRRHGLCASVTRMVSFGKPSDELRAAHALAAMIDATEIFFCRPGQSVADVFRRARRIYEKFNAAHEWTLDYQGSIIGYLPRELMLAPDCDCVFQSGVAVCWTPSVGPARSSDTIVIDSRGYEVVTEAQRWPKIEVQVKGFTIPRPGVLET